MNSSDWARLLAARSVSAALVGIVFATFVCWHGIPALRHDWLWPPDRNSVLSSAWAFFSGWVPRGIGMPRPYPTDYLIVLASVLDIAVFGNSIGFVIFVFAMGYACAYAGMRLFHSGAQPFAMVVAAGVFAAFNPWVYSKIVAGHVAMIIAYAALMLLASELSLRRSDPWRTALWCILSLGQIQFFLVAFAIVLFDACFSSRSRIAALSCVIVALPIFIGLGSETRALLAIPYSVTWQYNQSVDPAQALVLLGYFTQYTQAFPIFSIVGLWAIVALSVTGALVARGTMRIFALLAVVSLVTAMGLKGPLGTVYQFVVTHLPASAVYRELYDIIGFAAICYIALSGVAVNRWRVLGIPWVVAVALASLAWITVPPTNFWVPRSAIPTEPINAPARSRFAAMPPFQPLSFNGRGSGLDPATAVSANGTTLLNDDAITYPEDAALARFLQSGNTKSLAALSVSLVVGRAGFATDYAALQGQLAVPIEPRTASTRTTTIPDWLPELAAFPSACIDIAPNIIDDGCAFFGDVPEVSGPGVPELWKRFSLVQVVEPGPVHLLAKDGWVDIRQAFAAQPELGEGLGGVLTTSATDRLPLHGGRPTLLWVRGELVNQDGAIVSGSTRGYRWTEIPANTTSVNCRGECAVIAQSDRVPTVVTEQVASHTVPIHFREFAPWLIQADGLPNEGGVLRYNVRFDPHWIALTGPVSLPHFRIDALFNGWLFHGGYKGTVVIFEYIALVQFLFQIVGACWSILVLLQIARARFMIGAA